ncbi:hypothetical protein BGW41_003679 [Actinomortierella wolfii]|nr:hypothetical protein BGW41_003679 [Actinomortierella wolfii]
MQSTRWRLAVDSPSTNHRSHQQQQQQRDDNDTQSLITKDRQRKPGQKHGDIIPVPEMFDAELNEAKVELMNHAVYRQRRAHRPKDNGSDDDKNSVFCKTCRNNHRLTYQMMSAYLPDEDDPDYERLLNNIEHKRKVLEQRYPPVCDECLPKVEQVLAHQHANLRINLFNAALKKSKVDHIRYIRKYPRLSWIFAAFLWICGNTVLLLIHYYAAGLPDLLPPLGRWDLLKQPALLAQDLIKAIARPNLMKGSTTYDQNLTAGRLETEEKRKTRSAGELDPPFIANLLWTPTTFSAQEISFLLGNRDPARQITTTSTGRHANPAKQVMQEDSHPSLACIVILATR